MAQADATLKGAVAVVTFGAVGLGFGLALAVALEGDSDGERVLEAHRFDDEGFLLLFGATASSGLHTERHLVAERRESELYQVRIWKKKNFHPDASKCLERHGNFLKPIILLYHPGVD